MSRHHDGVHNSMHWVRCGTATLVLDPVKQYLVQMGAEGDLWYDVFSGERLAYHIRTFRFPVPYVCEVLDPRRLDYAHTQPKA